MNPFVYQRYCEGESFCDRKEEFRQLDYILKSNKENILLYSKRKIGKTSLVKEYFKTLDKKDYFYFYFDIFNSTCYVDFVKIIYKNIAFTLVQEYGIKYQLLKDIFFRVDFTAIIKDDNILFTPNLNSYNFEELINDIYKGLDRLRSEYNKSIIIAFDEFQEIANFLEPSVYKAFFKYIFQNQEFRYIFTGFKKQVLCDLFNKKSSSLYNRAVCIELKAIDKMIFYDFVNNKLQNRLPFEIFDRLYLKTEGESKLIQEVCYHIYCFLSSNQNKQLNSEIVDNICNSLLESKSEYFKLLLNELSIPQKIALKAVALNNGIELYKKENLFNLHVTKSSLNTAIRRLYKNDIIDKEDQKYYITNKCFDLWCKKEFI